MKKNLEELIAKADESPDGTAHVEEKTATYNEDTETSIKTTSKTTISKSKSAQKERSSETDDESQTDLYEINEEIVTTIVTHHKATAPKAKPTPKN